MNTKQQPRSLILAVKEFAAYTKYEKRVQNSMVEAVADIRNSHGSEYDTSVNDLCAGTGRRIFD